MCVSYLVVFDVNQIARPNLELFYTMFEISRQSHIYCRMSVFVAGITGTVPPAPKTTPTSGIRDFFSVSYLLSGYCTNMYFGWHCLIAHV